MKKIQKLKAEYDSGSAMSKSRSSTKKKNSSYSKRKAIEEFLLKHPEAQYGDFKHDNPKLPVSRVYFSKVKKQLYFGLSVAAGTLKTDREIRKQRQRTQIYTLVHTLRPTENGSDSFSAESVMSMIDSLNKTFNLKLESVRWMVSGEMEIRKCESR